MELYRQLIKIVNEQTKRYGMLQAKGIMENATGKAQNIAHEKYNIVAKVSNKYLTRI